jgi:hypothetical protein
MLWAACIIDSCNNFECIVIMRMKSRPFQQETILLTFISMAFVVIWSLLLLSIFLWNLHVTTMASQELAKTVARAHFDKDQAFRHWGTIHGGVYVPVTEHTPPNPYLAHVEDRDIVTEHGIQLTLMNPAYMLRQMQEDFTEDYYIKGHITSLQPLRPENAPDEWEIAALESFETGIPEAVEFTTLAGQRYLRLMEPMITHEKCLKCHAHQGYQAGDIRGGVSISLPMCRYDAAIKKTLVYNSLFYFFLWMTGCGIILFGYLKLKKQTMKQWQDHETIQTLVQGTTGAVGDVFFHNIVEQICLWLRCDIAIIGETDDHNTVHSLAMYKNGEFVEHYRFPVDSEPWTHVLQTGFCHHLDRVNTLFPNDPTLQQLKCTSFIGIPLLKSQGKPIGILCVMSNEKPSLPVQRIKEVLQIMAARASVELERLHAEGKQQQVIAELKQALHEVKTLEGCIPICMNCKKIRDDTGFWQHVEKYIQEHSKAMLSHGLCPDCAKEMYPDELEP